MSQQWGQQKEWDARQLEALVNIYDLLEKNGTVTESANLAVTTKIMKIMFETDEKGEPDESKPREEPKYDLWTAKDFNSMRQAIPYADAGKVEELLKALHGFDEDQDDVDPENRKWAWKTFRHLFEDTTTNSQCNFSNKIIGSITNLLSDFGSKTGFQAQTMNRIDHALKDQQRKAQVKEESDSI